MFNKSQLISQVITEIEQEIRKSKEGLESAKQAGIDAPSFMESASDTTKSQMSMIVDNYTDLIANKTQSLKTLREINEIPSSKIVKTGSIVEVSGQGPQNQFYFIITGGGCYQIKSEDQEIFALDPETPLAKIMISKKAGDIVSFRNKDLRIENVY